MSSPRRCVVLPNKKTGNQVVLAVPGSLDEFLRAAGDKLGMSAKKAFTENGALLDDVALIRDDEKVYISSGEPFWKSDSSHVRMYKIAVLGAGGVGKSCLSLRYVKNALVDVYDPTIEDAFRQQTVIDGNTCMLDILDTAGQEDMKMLRRQWVQDRDGFVLVYSIVDKRSFEELGSFLSLIRSMKQKVTPMVIVGNKSDMKDQRTVQAADAEALARQHGAKYIEASARTGECVVETFELLVRTWNEIDGITPGNTGKPDKSKKPAKSGGGCSIL